MNRIQAIRYIEQASEKLKYLPCAMTVALDIYNLYRGYQASKDIAFDNTIIDNLQTRLMGVAQIVEGFEQLCKVAHNSEISEYLPFLICI